ncbi:MAG: gliding motility-associated ABC transporter substrate-binding protein GldG [Bacteroidales bacterium]|nr:gliding motility-associated ABC transporter substrate-binding protein GldG [Bacteroidales bacterium]
MHYLFRKELSIIIYSGQSIIVSGIFITVAGLLIWIFPGSYNMFDNGYASLDVFFSISPTLLLVLIPALTMRLFSEEKRTGTIELLFSWPVSVFQIVVSKYLALVTVILSMTALGGVYWVSVYWLGNPVGNIETGTTLAGYIGLFLTAMLFTAIGIFASACTRSQLLAFAVAVFGNSVACWGFELLASVMPSATMGYAVEQVGILSHTQSFGKGIIRLADCAYFIGGCTLFQFLSAAMLCRHKGGWRSIRLYAVVTVGVVALCCLAGFSGLRTDLTPDKRYSLNHQTLALLSKTDKPVYVTVYLADNTDADFLKLKQETIRLLDEFRIQTQGQLTYAVVNPNRADSDTERNRQRQRLLSRKMTEEIVTSTSDDGAWTQTSVFPWADVTIEDDTLPVRLLADIPSKSQQERISASIARLEYQFSEALQLLSQDEADEIVFWEGHGEIPEIYVYDAVEALGRYYQIFRGQLPDGAQELPPCKVVIIAGPATPFSEREKYLLDRYLVSGGSIFFLLDGSQLSYDALRREGQSPAVARDLNLTDLLFHYGVRINPVLLQDLQCADIPLKAGNVFVRSPWYFAPLLNPEPTHPVTRNLTQVKAEFAAGIDWTGNDQNIVRQVLLTTSSHSRTVQLPCIVSPDIPAITANYFNQQHIPVAVLLEGMFPSTFQHRPTPPGIMPRLLTPTSGKIIVAASSSIIRNEINWLENNQGFPLPVGYDSYMNVQFGNRDFIVNSVHYLAGHSEWISQQNSNVPLRLLDRMKIRAEKNIWQCFNLLTPLVILIALGFLTAGTRLVISD